MNLLNQLKQYTQVVAYSGDFESIVQFKAFDATNDPSLIFVADQKKEDEHKVVAD